MDRFVERYVLIILVRVLYRTIFYTGRTARAFILKDIPGFFRQCYVKVSCFPFYALNFSEGVDLYVGMPADLDQLGCEYSHGAVIGRKGLVKLGHVAPNAWRLFDQVHLETGVGKIERGLNAADTSADNHDVSKIAVPGIFTKLLNVFSYGYYFFHFNHLI
jgi:hypothetical protein